MLIGDIAAGELYVLQKMQKTRYITTDIVVDTDYECDNLISSFQDDYTGVFKYDGHKHKWHISIMPISHGDPERFINMLHKQIMSFPQKAKEEWDNAAVKEFYIGYQSGFEPHCVNHHLSIESIRLLSELNAGVGIAVYATDKDSSEDESKAEQTSGLNQI